jgi:hypothetical protein
LLHVFSDAVLTAQLLEGAILLKRDTYSKAKQGPSWETEPWNKANTKRGSDPGTACV